MDLPSSRRSPGGRSLTSRSIRRAGAAGLTLFLALVAGAGAQQESGHQETPAAAVAAVLQNLGSGDEDAVERAAEELCALGAAALDPMLDLLILDAAAGGESSVSARDRALTAAFGRLSSEALLSFLRGRLGAAPASDERVACLRLIAKVGDEESLPLAFDIARPGKATAGMQPAIDAELEHALAELLRREPRSYLVAAAILPTAPALQAPAARAIGTVKDVRGLELLEGLLADPFLETLVVTQATRLLPLASADQAEPFLEPLREHLLESEDGLRRAAALALGRLEDVGAIPNLIPLLDAENGTPCREAHWALCRITGLALPAERSAWEGWYREEKRWVEQGAPALFECLRSGDHATMVDAVRRLARHRLHREAIAEVLAKGFAHPDPQVRVLIVAGLVQLGGRRATAALEDARDDPNEIVRLRVAEALEVLQRPRSSD